MYWSPLCWSIILTNISFIVHSACSFCSVLDVLWVLHAVTTTQQEVHQSRTFRKMKTNHPHHPPLSFGLINRIFRGFGSGLGFFFFAYDYSSHQSHEVVLPLKMGNHLYFPIRQKKRGYGKRRKNIDITIKIKLHQSCCKTLSQWYRKAPAGLVRIAQCIIIIWYTLFSPESQIVMCTAQSAWIRTASVFVFLCTKVNWRCEAAGMEEPLWNII